MKKQLFRFFVLSMAIILVFGSFACSAAVITDGKDFYIAGDSNDDGLTDILDLIRLKKIVAGVVEGPSPATDFNGDKVSDSSDIVAVKRLLIGADDSKWSAIYK